MNSGALRLGAAVNQVLERKRHQAETLKAAEALREQEAGLRQAQRVAKLAYAVTRTDSSLESWSDTLPMLIGVNPARMPKSVREWLTLLHPDDRPLFRDSSIEAGRRGTRFDIEYRLRRALENDEFVLHYQPKVTLETRRIVGRRGQSSVIDPIGRLGPVVHQRLSLFPKGNKQADPRRATGPGKRGSRDAWLRSDRWSGGAGA